MTDVLGELRAALHGEFPHAGVWKTGPVRRRLDKALDAFAAAHPTLHEAGDCWETFEYADEATGEKGVGTRARYPILAEREAAQRRQAIRARSWWRMVASAKPSARLASW